MEFLRAVFWSENIQSKSIILYKTLVDLMTFDVILSYFIALEISVYFLPKILLLWLNFVLLNLRYYLCFL